MSMNTLEFRTDTTRELDRKIAQGATVGFFEDNVLRANFVGAKTVLIPELDMSGLGEYDRDNGFVQGAVSITSEPFTLSQDRARTFQIDREDSDESGIAQLAGEVLGEFVRTKVVPEVDAYCLSKVGGYAASEGQTVTGDPETEAYAMFNEALNAIRDEIGYDEELVCFADGNFMRALQQSPEVERQITVSDFKKGEVNLRVKMLDDVAILPVPSSRMKTAYLFKSGGAGQEEGGFAPMDSASSIGFLLLPKRACSLVKKSETLRTFSPEQNIKADAWKVDYRLYYDIFVRNSMKNAIRAYIY